MKFTDRFIQKIQPKEQRFEVLEGDGFTLRVTPTGVKSFYYLYKDGGKNHRLHLGTYPHCSLAEAREKHRAAMSQRHGGENPALMRRRSKDERSRAATVGDLIDDYIERWAKPNKRSWREDQRNLDGDVRPVIGDKLVTEVTRRDVIALLDRIIARGALRQSNIVYSVLRRMFNFALEQNYQGLDYSPCDRVKLRVKDAVRERALSADEIRIFWHRLPRTGVSAAVLRILRLILVTAQRPGEVAGMTYGEIDGRWWTIPPERSKNKREQRVYLSDLALEIVGDTDDKKGLVFPSPVEKRAGGEIHVSQVAQALRRLFPTEKKPGKLDMAPFKPHDLRRTAATRMAESGIEAYTIDRILGHSQGVLRQTYNKYQYDKEKQAALTAWGHRLREILSAPLPTPAPPAAPRPGRHTR